MKHWLVWLDLSKMWSDLSVTAEYWGEKDIRTSFTSSFFQEPLLSGCAPKDLLKCLELYYQLNPIKIFVPKSNSIRTLKVILESIQFLNELPKTQDNWRLLLGGGAQN